MWEDRVKTLTADGIPAGALDGPPAPDELDVATALMVEMRYILALYHKAGMGEGGINVSISAEGWTVERWSREPSTGYNATGTGPTLIAAWKDMELNG